MYVGEVSVRSSKLRDADVLTLPIVTATSLAQYHGKDANLS